MLSSRGLPSSMVPTTITDERATISGRSEEFTSKPCEVPGERGAVGVGGGSGVGRGVGVDCAVGSNRGVGEEGGCGSVGLGSAVVGLSGDGAGMGVGGSAMASHARSGSPITITNRYGTILNTHLLLLSCLGTLYSEESHLLTTYNTGKVRYVPVRRKAYFGHTNTYSAMLTRQPALPA